MATTFKVIVTAWAVFVMAACVVFSGAMTEHMTQIAGTLGAFAFNVLCGVAGGMYAGWQTATIWRK